MSLEPSSSESSLESSVHTAFESPAGSAELATTSAARDARFWPAWLMLMGAFAVNIFTTLVEMPMFYRFGSRMLAGALLPLGMTIWWWTNRRIALKDRAMIYLVVVASGAIITHFYDASLVIPFILMICVPVVLTLVTLWLKWATRHGIADLRLTTAVVAVLAWSLFALVRTEGMDGVQQADYRWRWSPSAEEQYLAERAAETSQNVEIEAADAARDQVQPDDWPHFRGPHWDGAVWGTQIAQDWTSFPPRKVWRQRIGPGWSGMTVVGDQLYTQEQRGEEEVVVCLQASTGKEIWSHGDVARFWESVAGAGPRATPTFADGRIYTLGATGVVNCLDAASGQQYWQRDLVADTGAALPMWGFSSSPLVMADLVLVYGGGKEKSLVAYETQTGNPRWYAALGTGSYASPIPAVIDGQRQVLMFDDFGLSAVDAATGAVIWQHAVPIPGAPRSVSPLVVNDRQVLFSSEADIGAALVTIERQDQQWSVEENWISRDLKPSFNDFVIDRGVVFGFNDKIFGSMDLQTGKRRWKKGRYGHGQVLLLADQHLLLVLAETGEVVLMTAQGEQHEELARFAAIDGKTWNHPTLVRNQLFVRNGEEIACYKLHAGR